MRGSALLTGIVALGIIVSIGVADAAPGYEIRLKSRTFTPEAATDDADQYLRSLGRSRGHVLLQMVNASDPVEREILEDAGVEFIQYLPENTWIVGAPRDLLSRTAAATIRWAGPLVREDRLHPRLWEDDPRSWSRTEDGRWRLYVRFLRDVNVDEARGRLLELGAEIRAELPAFVSFEIVGNSFIVEALATDDRIYWIRETTPAPVENNDDNRLNTGAGVLQEPPYGLDGTGVVVGVWDGGSVDTHPDFGVRLIQGDNSPVTFHATHVGGTVGGNGINSQSQGGSALQWRGMAPNVGIVTYDWNNPIAEHDPAINEHGASVSQNSWSYGVEEGSCDLYGDYDFTASEYDEIVRGIYGGSMVIAHSAGNERDDGDCGMMGPPYENYGNINPPSTGKNTLTIGAINSNNNTMTNFSSWGPVDDGRIKPELVGPGCQTSGDGSVTSTSPGGGYAGACGTSMSTPTVSGCISLLQQSYLDEHGELPNPALVRALLINTATDLGRTGPDYSYGFGNINVQAAVDQMQADAWAEDQILSNTDIRLIEFEVVPGSGPLNVTLGWIDPAGSPGATFTLVNNLDLVLVAPDMTEHLPWDLTPGLPSLDAVRRANGRDNVEQVTVDTPIGGVWTARVTATNVPVGPQEFALAGTSPQQTCAGGTLLVPSAEHPSIQAAITAASFCDTILVAPGTYQEALVVDQRVILIATGGPDVTTIQAPIANRAMEITSDAEINGFTITGGGAFGGFPAGYGGGMYIHSGAAPDVRNCRFVSNNAQGGGGAIFVYQGGLTVEGCEFDTNRSFGIGGAIGLEATFSTTISGNVIHHSQADQNGGAISMVSASATIVGNTIANNNANTAGGAIYLVGANAVIEANIIADNTAPTASGIRCSGTVVLECNDIWNNDLVSCSAGTDDFSADPQFCDAAVNDYRIPETSPCAPDNSPAACGLVGALEPVVSCGVIDVGDVVSPGVPGRFAVYPAQPNPLTRSTRVKFDLPARGQVRLDIFDVGGRQIRTVVADEFAAGSYSLEWDGRDSAGRTVTAGVYFYELRAGTERVARKLVVLP